MNITNSGWTLFIVFNTFNIYMLKTLLLSVPDEPKNSARVANTPVVCDAATW